MGFGLGWWILVILFFGWSLYFKAMIKKKKLEKEEMMSSGGEQIKAAAAIPRGRSGWPFIGETLDFIACGFTSRPATFMDKRKSLYGKVFKTHILGRPVIVSTDADVNRVVLQNQGNIFVPYYPKSITDLLGESSILQMNGTLQRRVHALIGGFLRSPQLKARMAREIENSVKLTFSGWNHKRTIYLQEETKKITFEALVRMLMSIDPGEDLNFLRREYGEFIKGLICLPIRFPGSRLYKSLKAKERLLEMVRRVVEKRKAAMDKTNEKGTAWTNDAVDVLLRDASECGGEGNQRLPLDFISGNIVEMMIPGEDSVPMAMTLAVKFLSDSPVALSRLVEENMELKRQKGACCEDYAWTDYMSLNFTQNVISETLRMANIINAVWRKALKDVEIKGFFIPKGWCVLASFCSVHMDEENYENPYEFNPWRWEKPGGAAVNSNSFTPFGGGQRLCPGLEISRLEISIFLHHLVTSFRWVAGKDEIVNFPTVKMKRKLPITIFPMDH
ncbi:3-epi-6-deoxocathasterone 23-monooxygenase CYP90C1 [Diospyros lotus]|uniref:3-epi-6-deoxocathasterone 23-monooxygenase CYP90C1 n=1 Tax=Diospyros lotus TaxID=55363 RepID=UPI0022537ECA|nr:3-epi-6-deoxocathasterone 23-monooxygenase CYP90C1 [Diospyros lotus]